MSEITERRQITINVDMRITRCDGCGLRIEPTLIDLQRTTSEGSAPVWQGRNWHSNTDRWYTVRHYDDKGRLERDYCPSCGPQAIEALRVIEFARFGADGPDDDLDGDKLIAAGPRRPKPKLPLPEFG